MFEKIEKRDGRIVEFDSSKITAAIAKAGNATGEFGDREARKLTLRVLTLSHELRLGPCPRWSRSRTSSRRCSSTSPVQDDRQGLHHLPRAARADPRDHRPAADVDLDRPLPRQARLAGQREHQHGLFAPGPEQLRLLRGQQDLLAEQDLPPRDPRAPTPRATSTSTTWASCPSTAWAGTCRTCCCRASRGRAGKVESTPAKHLRSALGPDRQLLLHPAGRGGRRPGLLQLRHAARALHPLRRPRLRRGEAGAAGVRLQHQRADPGRASRRRSPTSPWTSARPPAPAGQAGDHRRRGAGARPTASSRPRWTCSTAPSSRCMCEGDAKGRVFTFPIPTYNITTDFAWDDPDARRALGGDGASTASPTSPTSSTPTCRPRTRAPCAAGCAWTTASCASAAAGCSAPTRSPAPSAW